MIASLSWENKGSPSAGALPALIHASWTCQRKGLMLRDSALPTVTNVEITALLQQPPRGGRTGTALKCRVVGP